MKKTFTKALTGLALLFSIGVNAQSNRFTVSNTNDAGTGSLRQAIIDANAKSGPDIILFNNGISGTISLTSTLSITETVSIFGPGSNNVTVSGNNSIQILAISQGNIHIQGLSLKNGLSQGGNGQSVGTSGGGGGGGLGGAIAIDNANVFIFDVKFDNNKAIGGNGGSCNVAVSSGQIDITPGGIGGAGPFGAGGYGGTSQNLGSGGTGGNGATLGAGGGGGGGAGGNPVVVSGPGGKGNVGGGGGGVGGIGSAGDLSNQVGIGGLFAGNGGKGNPATTGSLGSFLQPGGAGGGGAGLGGAIFINAGTLTLQNCTFTNNAATGGLKGTSVGESFAATNGQGKGGAIFSNTATIAIQNVSYSNNTAANQANTATDGNDVYGTTNVYKFQIASVKDDLLYDNYKIVIVGKFLRDATAATINGKSLTNFQAFTCIPDTTKDSVTAIMPVGFEEGPLTITAQGVQNQSPFYIKRIIVPNAITDLSAIAIGVEAIQLSWSDINNSEQGYRIFKSTNNGSSYFLYDSVGINSNTYTDLKAQNNQLLYYKIVPIYYNYAIPFSNIVSAKTTLGKKLSVNISIDESGTRCANVPFNYTVNVYLDNEEDTRNVYTYEWFVNGISKGNNSKNFSVLLNNTSESDSVFVKITSSDNLTLNNNKMWKSSWHVSNILPVTDPIVKIIPNTKTYCAGKKVGFEANVSTYDYNGDFQVKWYVNGNPKYVDDYRYNPQYPELDSLNEGDIITVTTINKSSCIAGKTLTGTSAPYIVKFTDGPKFGNYPKDTLVNSGTTLKLKLIATDTVPVKYLWEYKQYFNNGNASNPFRVMEYYQDEPFSATKQYATGYNTNTLTLNNVNAKPDIYGYTISEYRVKATGVCSSYSDFIKVKPVTIINVTNTNASGAGSLEDGLATLKSGGANYNSPYVKVTFDNGLNGTCSISNITLPFGTKEFSLKVSNGQSITLEGKSSTGYMFDLINLIDSINFENVKFSGNSFTTKYALRTGNSATLLNNVTLFNFNGGNDYGVINGSNLTISNCLIYANKARAIYSNGGKFNLNNSVLRLNDFGGVYIYNNTDIKSTIRNTSIVKNGSVTNYYNSSAIEIDGAKNNVELINTTVALNYSGSNPSIGITSGKLTATSSTIANNITNWSAVYAKDGTFSLSNTILVGTVYTDKTTNGYDFRKEDAAKFVSEFGHNVIGQILNTNKFGLPILPSVDIADPQQSVDFSAAITGTIINVLGKNVIEDSLNNNGTTFTLPLVSCSPAINSGTISAAPFNDQRGVMRFDGKPDIGAYESSGLTINENISPKITITPVRQDLCSFIDTVTFSASIQNGGTAPQVFWYKNGVMVDTGLVANIETTVESQVVANVISNATCIANNGTSSQFVVFNNSGTYFTVNKDTTVCNSFEFNGTTIETPGIYSFAIKKKNTNCDSLVVKLNVTFNSPYSYGKLTGSVFKNNTKYGSYVYVYKLADNNATLPTLEYQNYFNGDFEFNYLQWGKYVVLAKPENHKVTDVATYYGGDYQYQNATIFNVGCKTFEYNNLNIDIDVLKTLPVGTGSINGTVQTGAAAARVQSSNANIRIYLIKEPNGDIVGQTLTDANGEFSFTNLPDGDYKTVADIVGYTSDTSTVFTIGNGNSARVSSLCIDQITNMVGACAKLTSVNDLALESLDIYPNPSTGIFNLNIENATYKVFNNHGQIITIGSNNQIDLSNYPSNIYLVKIEFGGKVKEFKLIKN